MRNLLRFLFLLIFCAPLPARAQLAPDSSPLPGSRIIRTFDFEETRLGNFESTPKFWAKVGGKGSIGYPAYSSGAFDHTVFRSSDTSFKLHTEGGSVAYRFPSPTCPPDQRIPIQPNADYYILAFVRSAGLTHARADLVAWLTDDKGNLQLDTEAHCQPFHPQAAPEGSWQVLYIYMPGPVDPPDAPPKTRYLALQAGLLQPQQLGETDTHLGKFAIFQQDINGSVWFDDLVVFRLPRVGINVHKPAKSPTPAGIFSADEPVELDLLVSDLASNSAAPGAAQEPASRLHPRLRITDDDRLLYASQDWQADTTSEKSWSFRYTHPPLPAGLYTATLEVFDDGVGNRPLIARRQAQFLCLPRRADPMNASAQEFGMGAIAWTRPEAWTDLPAFLRLIGASTIQLPAWRRDMSEEALTRRDPPFDALLATLQRQNVRTIGAFSELPAAITSRLKNDNAAPGVPVKSNIFALLGADSKLWRPFMAFILTRYTNRIDQWELGSPDAPYSGTLPEVAAGRPAGTGTSERAAAFYSRTYPDIASLLPRPHLVIPWNALFDFTPDQFPHARLDLRLPPVIKPAQIPAYLASFRRPDAPLIAHLEGLDPRDASRSNRLADFAQRVVYTRSSSHETILFDVAPGKPDELTLVYRTMAHALGDSTFAGELPVARGVRAFLFTKAQGAALVLWNESAPTKQAPLDLPMGPKPQLSDLLGNAGALTTDPITQLTHLTVAPMPIVIEQVDPRPLQLMASFAIATPVLPAGADSVQTEIVLKNPYADPLIGRLRLQPPKGWTLDPPSFSLSLAPGAAARQPVILRYPFTETAGIKPLAGRLDLDPGNPAAIPGMDLSLSTTITSDQIDMECFTIVQPNGDILLQQVITNTSKASLDAQSYALLPGFRRQTRYISELAPGETTIKRYTFLAAEYVGTDGRPASPANLKSTTATLGVRQNDGRTLLTKAVPLE